MSKLRFHFRSTTSSGRLLCQLRQWCHRRRPWRVPWPEQLAGGPVWTFNVENDEQTLKTTKFWSLAWNGPSEKFGMNNFFTNAFSGQHAAKLGTMGQTGAFFQKKIMSQTNIYYRVNNVLNCITCPSDFDPGSALIFGQVSAKPRLFGGCLHD